MAAKSAVQKLIDDLRVEANAFRLKLDSTLEMIERLEKHEEKRMRENKVRADSSESTTGQE
ncbi:MAG: hypothetical protein GY941_00585 [Planctomycetes bacterium]|nr:hypothetical protein [Planctomycetota bacterium]